MTAQGSFEDQILIACIARRKEPSLWKTACYRDFGESSIHNKLHLQLNKTWEWVYQTKAVYRPRWSDIAPEKNMPDLTSVEHRSS